MPVDCLHTQLLYANITHMRYINNDIIQGHPVILHQ